MKATIVLSQSRDVVAITLTEDFAMSDLEIGSMLENLANEFKAQQVTSKSTEGLQSDDTEKSGSGNQE